MVRPLGATAQRQNEVFPSPRKMVRQDPPSRSHIRSVPWYLSYELVQFVVEERALKLLIA